MITGFQQASYVIGRSRDMELLYRIVEHGRKKLGQHPLRFVRRGVILLQRGNAIPSRSRRPPWAFPP
jgi:hypothetical protein